LLEVERVVVARGVVRLLLSLEVERVVVFLGVERLLLSLEVERLVVVLGVVRLLLSLDVERVVVLGVERLLGFLRGEEGLGPPITGNAAKVCGPTIPSGASP
jgi:hypothetical protein